MAQPAPGRLRQPGEHPGIERGRAGGGLSEVVPILPDGRAARGAAASAGHGPGELVTVPAPPSGRPVVLAGRDRVMTQAVFAIRRPVTRTGVMRMK
jgi:hypothetical protein